jgi:nucleoside-diphosphate-sugar epimerase
MKKKKGRTTPLSILVVGGAGYVGSRLVPRLIEEGHRVKVVDLLWFGNNLKGVPVTKRDVLDLDPEALRGFNQVIFLAGLSNDPMADLSPPLNYIHNVAAPAHLAYIAKKAGVARFIYAESCSVYGSSNTGVSSESSPAKSAYPYGISKLCGGFAAAVLADDSFSVIRLRMGTVCGWSPRMRFDLIVNAMFRSAQTDGKITVNNPDIWRPILAISDAVEAYVLSVRADKNVSGIFNVSSGNFTVGDVAKRVAHYFKKRRGVDVEIVTKHVPDVRNYRVSTKRALRELGFKPRGSIESILDELSSRFSPRYPFGDERFYNIRVFERLFKDGFFQQRA